MAGFRVQGQGTGVMGQGTSVMDWGAPAPWDWRLGMGYWHFDILLVVSATDYKSWALFLVSSGLCRPGLCGAAGELLQPDTA